MESSLKSLVRVVFGLATLAAMTPAARIQASIGGGSAQPLADDAPPADGRAGQRADRPDPFSPTNPAVPQAWFRPDPYPNLGSVDEAGLGWQYVRIAANDGSRGELGVTTEQLKKLKQTFDAAQHRASAEEGRLRREHGKLPGDLWPAAYRKIFDEAQTDTHDLLSHQQHRRLEQLVVQRLGYRAFLIDRFQTELSLSDSQRQRAAEIWKAHVARVKEFDTEHGQGRVAADALDVTATERNKELHRLRSLRSWKGQRSHRQAWDEMYLALTEAQREKFETLRGRPVE